MLSRIANNMFWAGRYIERAESSARLINATTMLLLDLPGLHQFDWHTLVEILGSAEAFDAAYPNSDEAHVMTYLALDRGHFGSVASSIAAARENLRSARDHVPRELWEEINALHLFMGEQTDVSQRVARSHVMDRVIRGGRLADGHISSGMSRDAAHDLFMLGVQLERADMTTRIIDVRASDLLEIADDDPAPYRNAQWISVLKSLSAFQMYRRHVRARVSGPSVVRFLLADPAFPRSTWFCLRQVGERLARLPSPGACNTAFLRTQRVVNGADAGRLTGDKLSRYLDRIQFEISGLANAIQARYFPS